MKKAKLTPDPVRVSNRCCVCADLACYGFCPPGTDKNVEARIAKTKWYCPRHRDIGRRQHEATYPSHRERPATGGGELLPPRRAG